MGGPAAIASALGFAFRRTKRELPACRRRSVVLEHLAVAIDLVAELQVPIPEVVRAADFLFLSSSLVAALEEHELAALRRRLAGCRVRVAARASPLP